MSQGLKNMDPDSGKTNVATVHLWFYFVHDISIGYSWPNHIKRISPAALLMCIALPLKQGVPCFVFGGSECGKATLGTKRNKVKRHV